MLISCGNRGFGLTQVRAWEFEPSAAVLRVWVGMVPSLPLHEGELVFQDEEAADVLAQLRRHAAAATSTLDAIDSLQRADDPVA